MDDPKLIPCPECGGTGKVPLRLDNLPTPLSAPDVAAVPGDGLLTMEEILGLKLNADWVVPSACDTGVRPRARVLLRRNTGHSGHQLVGPLGVGA
jgi:hypothetical protein